MTIQSILRNALLPILIFIIGIIIFVTYVPGTFITGWDTLHPELNFPLNFARIFFGVWRDNQGFGAVAGHSHMADLPRLIIMWILHFTFPVSMLRYLYMMLCLLLGPVGVFFLVKYIFTAKKIRFIGIISFLAGLFYLFNLSTIQQFYVPLEMFTTQYAFLPWILLFSIQFILTGKKKPLLLFALATLLATPQAFAAHLWYPFFGIYTLFLLVYSFLSKRKIVLKKSAILIVLTLVLNAFWLLPNIYYIATSSWIPSQSKQNRIYSQEYRLRNREQGYLKDVAIARGFYFNWQAYDYKTDKIVPLMPEWIDHLKNPFILFIGYALFTCAMSGLIIAFKRKDILFIAFFPYFVLPFIFLMNHTFPFSVFFDLLTRFPLSEEALRFVFTKFSILIILSYVLYFSYFLATIFSLIKTKGTVIFAIIISFSLIAYCLPVFSGHLISNTMKISIPKQYNDFWTFMKSQPDGVVLSFPLNTFSGWQYYDWGYQGSGFLWFDLNQPLLDRDFDRWSVSNEQSFRELNYAVYAKNSDLVSKDLTKFNISYIVWDKSVISLSEKNRQQILYARETASILDNLIKSGKVELIWKSGKIEVYGVKNPSPIISLKNISAQIAPDYRWNFFDAAYFQWGDYISSSDPKTSIYYPFRDILKPDERVSLNTFSFSDDNLSASIKNQSGVPYSFIQIPDDPQNNSIHISSSSVTFPVQKKVYSSQTIMKSNKNRAGITYDEKNELIDFSTKNYENGVYIPLDTLTHNLGYMLVFHSKNNAGLPLRICLKNFYSNQCTLYDELSRSKNFSDNYFFIPPIDDGLGYGLSIDNISYGNYVTHNQLKDLQLIAFPYNYASQMFYYNSLPVKTTVPDVKYLAQKIYPYEYVITTNQSFSQSSTIVLNQSYHTGWQAYSVSKDTFLTRLMPILGGHQLKDHILVNNWANGWKIDRPGIQTVVIVFWPQYLEFLGFIFIPVTFLTILLRKSHRI